MLVTPAALLKRYSRKGVLIDANLLVGYIVGRLAPHHLSNCRATKNFSVEDFELLHRIVSEIHCLVTTPHVLTEVSNLAGRLPETLYGEFRRVFRRIIEGLTEVTEASKTICAHEDFLRLGLADTAISMVSPGRYLVLTDELALAGRLRKRNVHVINFNNLRFLDGVL